MGAFVDHNFDRGFLLDEERLRKVHDIIASRIGGFANSLAPSYKVFRGDSYSYETDSLETVAKEDNEDWRAITKLEILAHDADVFNFKLAFSDKGVIAEISGDDRDAVFLLFSDLKAYIQEQVLVGRVWSNHHARTVGFTLMIVMMIGFLLQLALRVDPASLERALSSTSIEQKLNFLIKDRLLDRTGFSVYGWMLGLLIFFALGTTGALETAWRVMFPANVFLFGARKKAFERRRALLGRIFWVIFVGLAVSTVAGGLVWYFTKS